MTKVYLVQHAENGYVHMVFDNLQAAIFWLQQQQPSVQQDYNIIERELLSGPYTSSGKLR